MSEPVTKRQRSGHRYHDQPEFGCLDCIREARNVGQGWVCPKCNTRQGFDRVTCENERCGVRRDGRGVCHAAG